MIVSTEFKIGLYGVVEADLKICCNRWSEGFFESKNGCTPRKDHILLRKNSLQQQPEAARKSSIIRLYDGYAVT